MAVGGSGATASRLSELVAGIISRVVAEEAESLERAAEMVADAIASGGLEYLFGTGHSMLVALEASFRAGGLVRTLPLVDLSLMGVPSAIRASHLERLPGYARALIESATVVPNSVGVVVSNSGKNSVPVEMALEMRARGMRVVGVTSLEYSRALAPENPYGKRLFEVVDVVIDNKVPAGDAAYEIPGGPRVFPVSTVVNSFIVHAVNSLAAELLVARGYEPEVWTSVNVPGGRERNQLYLRRYRDVLRYL